MCLPAAEPWATTAKGFAFTLLTQRRGEGDRVISLQVCGKAYVEDCGGGLDLQGKPPAPDIHFHGPE